MDKIAILIPCYNESKTIGKVVKDWKAELPEAVVYVYDNNSTDHTDVIAREAGAVVRYEYQQGKGNVVRRMFREIDAECCIMIDGDDTYPADAARAMAFEVLERQADMVIGDRLSSSYFTENKRPFHNVGNTVVRSCINHLFHSNLQDIMTGYRAFGYQFVKTFPVLSKGFEIETEMSIHAVEKNMHIRHVVVQYRDRPEGSESKLNTVTDGIKVLRTVVNLYRSYKPLRFFGFLSFVLMALAILFFIPIMIEYIRNGLVPQFPTLIVCGFCVIASFLSLFSGMILQNLIQKNKQDFEFRLHLVHEEFIKKTERQRGEV